MTNLFRWLWRNYSCPSWALESYFSDCQNKIIKHHQQDGVVLYGRYEPYHISILWGWLKISLKLTNSFFLQYTCVALKGHLVFAGLQGSTCAIEVYNTNLPNNSLIYSIPLKTLPKKIIVKENYFIIGMTNETVKIVSFNIPANYGSILCE